MSIVTPGQLSKAVKEALEAINAIRAALGRVADTVNDQSTLAYAPFNPKESDNAPALNVALDAALVNSDYPILTFECESQLKNLEAYVGMVGKPRSVWLKHFLSDNDRVRKLPQEGSKQTVPCFGPYEAYVLYYPTGKEVACHNAFGERDLVAMLRCEGGQKFLAEWEAWFADMLPKAPAKAKPTKRRGRYNKTELTHKQHEAYVLWLEYRSVSMVANELGISREAAGQRIEAAKRKIPPPKRAGKSVSADKPLPANDLLDSESNYDG